MLHHSLPAAESTPQTFRTFVTGPHNALAYNAALTVARTPGNVYNPLYITGGSGIGKSHLLRAVAAYLTPRLHGAEVILVSGDAFSQDFVSHLRRGHMLAFRRRYRRAGTLLIDGVAIMAGRETAAEELVHTLDALREANRQIIIADEQRPSAVRGLPDRLRSRLGASLIVAIGAARRGRAPGHPAAEGRTVGPDGLRRGPRHAGWPRARLGARSGGGAGAAGRRGQRA